VLLPKAFDNKNADSLEVALREFRLSIRTGTLKCCDLLFSLSRTKFSTTWRQDVTHCEETINGTRESILSGNLVVSRFGDIPRDRRICAFVIIFGAATWRSSRNKNSVRNPGDSNWVVMANDEESHQHRNGRTQECIFRTRRFVIQIFEYLNGNLSWFVFLQ